MASNRELFVNSVRTVPVDGLHVTPTVIKYGAKGFVIGYDAVESDDTDFPPIDDFKIALGGGDYGKLSSRLTAVSKDLKRSVVGIAQDFMISALSSVESWALHHSITPPKHVLVAEPLALEDTTLPGESWISNYRSNIRRILHKFSEVDFLPEPFAVFQYYRYGVRHPLISEKRKHVALVLDFGGGTFDVSVIETTAQGDISKSGRNQRPFGAKSIAVAGYFINQRIAEYLLFKSSPEHVRNRVVRKALDAYYSSRLDPNDPTINPEIHTFVRNFGRIVQAAEKAKIAICSSIINWDLSANLGAKVPVRVRIPIRPFAADPDYAEISLDAAELREIFEKEVWVKKLRSAIVDVIRRSSSDLEGNPISVVLLSGGSSNIGWLKKLIERDLVDDLVHADIVELSENFQEIVSKGLAVECARRYYTEGEGDFQAVLYNKLCLLLSPNGRGIELRKFKVLSPTNLIESGEDAVLLPSASSLRARFNQELRWKVRLSTTPSRQLEYHFMRSSFDPNDVEGQLNVVQKVLTTPKDASFGQAIDVALTVREDGTAVPRFIYGRGNAGREAVVEGTPFFLDMTSAIGDSAAESYIGFDFGSSTSSFSLVSRADVNVYKERDLDPNWRELSDLVPILPYPIAARLARYLGETNSDNLFKRGRAVLESSLCFLAFSVYSYYRSRIGRQNSALLKNLAHRSAGPLWALLRETLGKVPQADRRNLPASKLLEKPYFTLVDEAVSEIPKEKHEKEANVDFGRILRPVCNIVLDGLRNVLFGYFEEVNQRAFSAEYEGVFRNLRGANEPFVDLYNYRGGLSFSKDQILLIDAGSGTALDMSPLYIWGLNSFSGDGKPPDLYMFDSVKAENYAFNAVQERPEIIVSADGNLAALWALVKGCRSQDKESRISHGLQMTKR
ncbi:MULTISPECIES: hypothetical protein [unclassified Mesorhizobium]|uniref:Hsp70 family protein n=1 Tax=unclassified Mesorhizobium TaxID=325217 RepID=UPI00040E9644|nr:MULTISPECIES: hypothetical protein [unclassified Mesorhizobium]WJI73931.1 hypothetical protein NLY37_23420 [Mesorhizobium sp. C395A]